MTVDETDHDSSLFLSDIEILKVFEFLGYTWKHHKQILVKQHQYEHSIQPAQQQTQFGDLIQQKLELLKMKSIRRDYRLQYIQTIFENNSKAFVKPSTNEQVDNTVTVKLYIY